MDAPVKLIRLMVSLLILKYVRNFSYENLVEHWPENVYLQYFSREQYFQSKQPCVATKLIEFRQRIGEPGVDLILQESIRVNDPPENDDIGIVGVNTTVQG